MTKVADSLEDLVVEFMKRAPFFRIWKPGLVDSGMAAKFLTTFDSLVKSFPALIAAGISRMEDKETRLTLETNLFQEKGEGNPSRSHHAIYQKFLSTAGINLLESEEQPFTTEWRDGLARYISSASSSSILGALAAGEFLAQPVLSRVYSVLKPLFPQSDDEYFTYHLELEANHVREISEAIELKVKNGGKWEEVTEGFNFGLSVWESYFERLTEYIAEKQLNR